MCREVLSHPPSSYALVDVGYRMIIEITERMKKWCSMSNMKLFIKQDELASEIQDCHLEINDCLTKLQVW